MRDRADREEEIAAVALRVLPEMAYRIVSGVFAVAGSFEVAEAYVDLRVRRLAIAQKSDLGSTPTPEAKPGESPHFEAGRPRNGAGAPHFSSHFTINNMRRYGGSFVRALAEALAVADPENASRIREAFPGLIARYGAHVCTHVDCCAMQVTGDPDEPGQVTL